MKACGRTDVHSCVLGAHSPTPACSHCGAPDPIRGDGGMALVCPRCVASLGRIAAEPFSVPETVRAGLLARSLDVVAVDGAAWAWTASWPAKGDDRLVRGAR